MTDVERTPTTPGEARGQGLRRVLGAVYALVALIGSAFIGFLSVFAVSPVQCPDTGASYLCTSGSGGVLTLVAIALLLLLCVGLGIGTVVVRTTSRAWKLFGGSLVAAVLALGITAFAASSWS